MKINVSIFVTLVTFLRVQSSNGTLQAKPVSSIEDKLPGYKLGHSPDEKSGMYKAINDVGDIPSGQIKRNESMRPIGNGSHTVGLVGPGGQIVAYVDSGHKPFKEIMKHTSESKSSINAEGSADYRPVISILPSEKENNKEYGSQSKGYDRKLSVGETIGFLNLADVIVGLNPPNGSSGIQRETNKGFANLTWRPRNVGVPHERSSFSEVQSTAFINSKGTNPEVVSTEHKPYDGTELQKPDKDSVGNTSYNDSIGSQDHNKDANKTNNNDGVKGIQIPYKQSREYKINKGAGVHQKPEIDSGVTKPQGDRNVHQVTNETFDGNDQYFGTERIHKTGIELEVSNHSIDNVENQGKYNDNPWFKLYSGTKRLKKPDKSLGVFQDAKKENKGYTPYEGSGDGIQKPHLPSGVHKAYNKRILDNVPQMMNKDYAEPKPYDVTGGLQKSDTSSGVSKHIGDTKVIQETNVGFGVNYPYNDTIKSDREIGEFNHTNSTEYTPNEGTGIIQISDIDSGVKKPHTDRGQIWEANKYHAKTKSYADRERHHNTNKDHALTKPYDVTGRFEKPNFASGHSTLNEGTREYQETIVYFAIYGPYKGTESIQKPGYSGVHVPYANTEGYQYEKKDHAKTKPYNVTGEIQELDLVSVVSTPNDGTKKYQETNKGNERYRPIEGSKSIHKLVIVTGGPNSYDGIEEYQETNKNNLRYTPFDNIGRLEKTYIHSGPFDSIKGYQEANQDSMGLKPFDDSFRYQETNKGSKKHIDEMGLEKYPGGDHIERTAILEHEEQKSGEMVGHIDFFAERNDKNTIDFDGTEEQMFLEESENYNPMFDMETGTTVGKVLGIPYTGGSEEYALIGNINFENNMERIGHLGDHVVYKNNVGDPNDYGEGLYSAIGKSEEADISVVQNGFKSNGAYLSSFGGQNERANDYNYMDRNVWWKDPGIPKDLFHDFEVLIAAFMVPMRNSDYFSDDMLSSFVEQVEKINEFSEYPVINDKPGDETENLIQSSGHVGSFTDSTQHRPFKGTTIKNVHKNFNPYLSEIEDMHWSTKYLGKYEPILPKEGIQGDNNKVFENQQDEVIQNPTKKWQNPDEEYLEQHSFDGNSGGKRMSNIGFVVHDNELSNARFSLNDIESSVGNMPYKDEDHFTYFKNSFEYDENINLEQNHDLNAIAQNPDLYKVGHREIKVSGRFPGIVKGSDQTVDNNVNNFHKSTIYSEDIGKHKGSGMQESPLWSKEPARYFDQY